MLFRNIVLTALLVGLLTGVLLSILQLVGVTPIIFAAETFETEEVEATPVALELTEGPVLAVKPAAPAHDHSTHDHHAPAEAPVVSAPVESATPEAADGHGHVHNEEAWAPADGGERTFYTFVSNILAAIGFAAVLLALMAQTHLQGLTRLSPAKGLLWGAAGFIALFVIPAIGLPPEIPGMEAAAIENRQGWWLVAVLSAVVGLACVAFAPLKVKGLGFVIMAIPYFVGAPHQAGPAITHPDPQAVVAMQQLHSDFIVASAATNLMFWLVLGLVSAWLLSRRLNAVSAPAQSIIDDR